MPNSTILDESISRMKIGSLNNNSESTVSWPVGKLDLIVPVYKNLQLVAKCLNSIRCNIGEISVNEPRLVVINDSPDDSEVTTYLREATSQGIIDLLIENDKNLGFVKSVNIALLESKKRFASAILINSDTETFPGTLAELVSVADMDNQFAFVSPRSNNASICTFPRPPHPQSGRSITPQSTHSAWNELKDLLPRYSYAPTAIGFYLLIKSVIIRNFEGLDERFGAGYEEENDLISRAGKVGFRAILANQAFAYHAGSASFSLTDIELDEHRSVNFEKLQELHPEFLPNVRSFERSSEYRAEALLKGLLPDSAGAVDIAFVLYSMDRHHHSTNEFIVNILRRFVDTAPNGFNITILCDPLTAKFHGLDELAGIRITPIIDQIYAIAFSFSQPYDLHTVNVMESIAPIVVYGMLDVTSIDCAPLRHSQNVGELCEYVAETSNGIVFISEFSKNTFSRRFPNYAAKLFTRILPTRTDCYAGSYENVRRGERHVFVAGNHFNHKDSSRVGRRLANAFPSLSFLILGAPGVYPPNARVLETDTLSDAELVQAICDSSTIVLPSFYEGSGFSLMHALAAGKPVVARDIPATREILGRFEDTKGVYLFSDDEQLERSLEESLRLKNLPVDQEIGEDWSQWTVHLASFLEDLIADRSRILLRASNRIKRGDVLRARKIIKSHHLSPAISAAQADLSESLVIAWRDLVDLPSGEFVDQAYETILGRQADPEGRIFHLNRLGDGLGRAELIAAFLENDEFKSNGRDVRVVGLPAAVKT